MPKSTRYAPFYKASMNKLRNIIRIPVTFSEKIYSAEDLSIRKLSLL